MKRAGGGMAATRMVPTVGFKTEARLKMPDATEEGTVGLQLRCMLPARDGEVLVASRDKQQ
jgi:hypothetical protein